MIWRYCHAAIMRLCHRWQKILLNKRKGGSKVRERGSRNGFRSRLNPVSSFSSDGGGICAKRCLYQRQSRKAERLGDWSFFHSDQEIAIDTLVAPTTPIGTGRARSTRTTRPTCTTWTSRTGTTTGTIRTTTSCLRAQFERSWEPLFRSCFSGSWPDFCAFLIGVHK